MGPDCGAAPVADPAAAFAAATEAMRATWADPDPAVRAAGPADLRQPLITLMTGWLQELTPAGRRPAEEEDA